MFVWNRFLIRMKQSLSRSSRIRTVKTLNEWDHNAVQFYSQFMRRGDLCFDIGANQGNRTKVFRALGAKVIAVEPQRECARILRTAFLRDPEVTVVEAACGRALGTGEIMIGDVDTVSSMAPHWLAAVKRSRRFGQIDWDATQSCTVITLDSLIARHGVPSFIKIDVEGYELEVLHGLSRSCSAVSFEFTPELLSQAIACIEHLRFLGFTRFSVSFGESMTLHDNSWYDSKAILELLAQYTDDTVIFGDIYARLASD